MARYCLDTSALIEAWVRLYPQDVFPSFWDRLDRLIEAGDVLCPDEVLVELEKKDDDLYHWVRSRQKLVYPLDDMLQVTVRRILKLFPRLVDSSRFRSQADPFVIALAIITGAAVVTMEKNSGTLTKPKIPDVCSHYNIRCINLLTLIREQKWNF